MIRTIDIAVPDMNDSYSRIVLDGKVYQIRFTWNGQSQSWTFGIYTAQREPIAAGIKLVPQFPVTLPYSVCGIPKGIFGVFSSLDRIERNSFADGKAVFSYISEVE